MKCLYDRDTKGEVLSMVTKMNLEETVAFVEAMEIGKRDVQLLMEVHHLARSTPS